ncbi:MAG: sigma-70 family RNA polymerase sigma factor [Phycisphaerales bacterium]|nr:sigma-70 family RNA polymerase sigma factor [Phycisphaerales bacterium]
MLMQRYDRLVRFAIFRASRSRSLRDPDWLDTIAADTWTAFLRSFTIGRGPDSALKSYLVSIARHKTVSAIRAAQRTLPAMTTDKPEEADDRAAPADLLVELEDIERLHAAVGSLDPEDQRILAQATLVTAKRWEEASRVLGMAESTLRSKWQRILKRLRRVMGIDP